MRKSLIPDKNIEQSIVQIDLKTRLKASHNRGSSDEHIIALVQFLARRAAEEDYHSYMDALGTPSNVEGGN